VSNAQDLKVQDIDKRSPSFKSWIAFWLIFDRLNLDFRIPFTYCSIDEKRIFDLRSTTTRSIENLEITMW